MLLLRVPKSFVQQCRPLIIRSSSRSLVFNLVLVLLLPLWSTSRSITNGQVIHQNQNQYSNRILQNDDCYGLIQGFQVHNHTSKNITDLSIEFGSSQGPTARIILEQYVGYRINLLVTPLSCPSNPTQCVKMQLGNIQDTIQTVASVAIYGDENGQPRLDGINYKPQRIQRRIVQVLVQVQVHSVLICNYYHVKIVPIHYPI
jgi:hypothetical protein